MQVGAVGHLRLRLVCLSGNIILFFGVVFKIILVLGFELYDWIEYDLGVVLFKAVSAILFLKGGDNSSNIFIFSKESLVLTAALYRTPCSDEDGHLFEDFAGSK